MYADTMSAVVAGISGHNYASVSPRENFDNTALQKGCIFTWRVCTNVSLKAPSWYYCICHEARPASDRWDCEPRDLRSASAWPFLLFTGSPFAAYPKLTLIGRAIILGSGRSDLRPAHSGTAPMTCKPMKRRQGDGRLCELRIILH